MDTSEPTENLYLPEDKKLLDQFDAIKILAIDPVAEMKRRQVDRIHLEATLRSRKTAVDLDKSNKKFSLAIIFIAIVQCFIALFEFSFEIASASSTKNMIGGFVLLAFCAFAIFYFLKKLKNEFI